MKPKFLFVFCCIILVFAGPAYSGKKAARLLSFNKNDKCGYMNKTGKIIIAPKFDSCYNFSEGLAGVLVADKLGYINDTGQFIIKPQFNFSVESFSEGFVTVSLGDHRNGEEQKGFIDTKGKLTIIPFTKSLYTFSEGLARFEKGGYEGYIDRNMKIVIEAKYKYAGSFYDGVARVSDDSGEHYYINRSEERVINREGRDFNEGLAVFEVEDESIGSRYGFMDTTGKTVIEAQFREAEWFYEGLCAVIDDKTLKWGFIDKTGKFVISPQFEEAERFSEGLGTVMIEDKWGFIDSAGNIVIVPQFDSVGNFEDGVAAVKLDEEWHYIDRKGKLISPHI